MLELMDCSLEQLMKKGKVKLIGKEKKWIASQIARGLWYLHLPVVSFISSGGKSSSNGSGSSSSAFHTGIQKVKPRILHRDLKAGNVLLNIKSDDEGNSSEGIRVKDVKIADFELSRTLESNESAHSIVGPPCIRAPEVIKLAEQQGYEEDDDEGDEQDEDLAEKKRGYGAPADVFSYGMLLYRLLTNLQPFQLPKKPVRFSFFVCLLACALFSILKKNG